ncbi:endonuclease domain-containing protein [Microbacterium sp. zg-YB36]|uniref:endonuclease domain-containing protein n=1 Tax=Microbacterium sp. zg-YB36 TaxID=2969407 RepID=UPI00214AB752|nr:endonuclease domain-containing protein [Microbacterium sp. zg-YB36]MDL5350447.1 endonuclease domain-containing protein [Microbacterium sp. zg-YB36]
MAAALVLLDWLTRRGGVAHTAEARAQGFSARTMADAVASGVRRVRRSWLVMPHVEDVIVRAVEAGGRVTCLTQARRLGLWVPEHDGIHVAVAPTASRLGDGVHAHWGAAPTPVSRYAVVDGIVNTLQQVARCVAEADALTVWESAVRKKLIDPATLAAVQWRGTRASAVNELASLLSDSGLETVFLAGLRAFDLPIRQQVRIDGHAVDFLIGDRLVIQLDGWEFHSAPADRRRDLRADARLVLRGYTVLRFDWMQVLRQWAFVEETVLLAVAQGKHRAPALSRA